MEIAIKPILQIEETEAKRLAFLKSLSVVGLDLRSLTSKVPIVIYANFSSLQIPDRGSSSSVLGIKIFGYRMCFILTWLDKGFSPVEKRGARLLL